MTTTKANLLAPLLLAACAPAPGPDVGATPRRVEVSGFVDDKACAACHPDQAAAWRGSHHDLAMQEARADTVLGDFDDGEFEAHGVRTLFFRDGERFLVETEGADGAPGTFEIAYTFGVEPLQQYLVEFPGGRLQSLTVAWDTGRERWFSLYPDQRIAADDALHWTGRYQNWNAMCAECHSTHLEKNYDPGADAYETTWVALDVGCQACHGPGEAHRRWAEPSGAKDAASGSGLVVDLRRGAPAQELQACAPCHSRRARLLPEPVYGQELLDAFLPERLHAGYYHADGQIQDEVYVYGSFVQSKMHTAGVACSDCHDPHSLELQQPGDALCMQCHSPNAPLERFPTLTAKDYDSPAHHFHPPDSEGARCVACHMPARTYMQVDPRRDHGFRVPRPDLADRLGTPDACSGCHVDRTPAWAAERVAEWTGVEERAPHFAQALAAGRAGAPEAPAALAALTVDPDVPAIVRATALDLLARYGPAAATAKLPSLADPDAGVRAAAVRGLDVLPPEERARAVAPLLRDPVRAVRVEAARALASVPPAALGAEDARELALGLDEYRTAQRYAADLPAAHLAVGSLDGALGDLEAAERSLLRALALDAAFLPARFELATLYNATGRNTEAIEVLREGARLAPDEGEVFYSLGLVLAEEGRLEETAAALGRAAELLPGRPRIRYNQGLALQQLGRRAEAERALLDAYRADPADVDVVTAVCIFFVQDEAWARAGPYARRLLELAPASDEARALAERIRAGGNAPR